MSAHADFVLQTGVDRALLHIRAGRHTDARFALEVAIRAAERIDGEDGDA
jgi:hypothetical protein